MASELGSSMPKRMPPTQGGSAQKPDPMVQPALANAMRYGKMFAQMSPAGSRGGRQAGGMGSMPGMQPQPGQEKPF